jgi:XrtN system VIT domain protein
LLFLISAFALNREMNVFENSADWFSVLLVVLCVNYIVFSFSDVIPGWLLYPMYFLLGAGFVTFLYLSVYLVPLSALRLAAAVLLGISLHTFVPALFCIYTIVLLRKTARGKSGYQAGFYSGILAVVVATAVFAVEWNGITHDLNSLYRQGVVGNRQGLPAWIEAAKGIQQDRLTEMVLKTGLVYSEPSTGQDDFLWRMPSRNFGEEKVHDPLIMTARFFSPNMAIPENERIRILESLYDARHKAQERLWPGENLQTEHVNMQVKIWPAFHLSYTEKLITVRNTSRRSFSSQERPAKFRAT